MVNFTISDKSMGLYELNKKTIARERGCEFNQIAKPTIKIYSNLSNINIHYYLKLRIPKLHRQFFRKLAQIVIIFKLFAMKEEFFFILHVVNGIFIIFHNFNMV